MMSACIIDGTALAARLTESVTADLVQYCCDNPPPCLAILTSGTDPASQAYIRSKTRALEQVGMKSLIVSYAPDASEQAIIDKIRLLNTDPLVDGILVQLPLPHGVNTTHVLAALNPQKDVDGFTPENLGLLLNGTPAFIPCTPQGILYLLQETGIPLVGSHAVIVGRSPIVGKPLAALLTTADATVTLCHSKTRHLAHITQQADILISAVGCPFFITGSMIKKGATVIDVGINRVPDATAPKGYRLTGDVVFEEAKQQAAFITPVPGGVGPLTVAMVLRNTLQAARLQRIGKSGTPSSGSI